MKRGTLFDIILKFVKDIKFLEHIEFCPRDPNPDELEEMITMEITKIPFCKYGREGAQRNIDKKYKEKGVLINKDMKYFFVKSENKVVAFIAYKQVDENVYYIAWECATAGGYAQALKLLVFCHAWDKHPVKNFYITLDLCGGHWLSHSSARKINLKFGFRYDKPKSIYKEAKLLCEQNKCSLKQLKDLLSGKTPAKYKKIREKFEDEYFYDENGELYKDENGNDIEAAYTMSCKVTKHHIIKLLVMIQESQRGYLMKKINDPKSEDPNYFKKLKKNQTIKSNRMVGGPRFNGEDQIRGQIIKKGRKRKRERHETGNSGSSSSSSSSSTRKFKKGDIVQTMWKPKKGEGGKPYIADAKILRYQKGRYYLQWHPLPELEYWRRTFSKRESELIKK